MAGRLVDIGSFPSALDAEQARSLLEDAGIPAMVEGANSGTWLAGAYAMGLIRILVNEEDAERATAVIEGRDPDATGEPSEAPAPRIEGSDADLEASEAPPATRPPLDSREPMAAYEAEAWARKTRLLAMLGGGIAVIFRITSPPPEVERNPRAARLLAQARGFTYAWFLVAVVLAVWLFRAR